MKIINAKVVESRKEEPGTEPDRQADTWLIEGELESDLMGWEDMKIDVPTPKIGAEIVETTMADASASPSERVANQRSTKVVGLRWRCAKRKTHEGIYKTRPRLFPL